jgi:DNA-binding transcriptional MerR regulator
MPYTVKKLAKLSGISVRTLHFYDEIGLLKPAYYGENNYRYYEEEQLLLLQQILFYRELGFQLNDIQKILNSEDFDKIEALKSHKKRLKGDLDRMQNLIKTIDKTIAHLRGKETMKLEEIFHGFTAEKQQLYEDFLVESGVSQDVINKTKDKVKNWKKEQWLENKREADALYAELAVAINKNLAPSSIEVQALIKKHYQMTTKFWIPTRESYIGLSQLYGSHPDFVKFYNDIHPKLLDFLVEAMKIFAERELS